MNMINEQFRKDTLEAWKTYMNALETSINTLYKDIDKAADMSERCTDEWCTATEHVINEINDALYTQIIPPLMIRLFRFSSAESYQPVSIVHRFSIKRVFHCVVYNQIDSSSSVYFDWRTLDYDLRF
jgi:hypothetical protein